MKLLIATLPLISFYIIMFGYPNDTATIIITIAVIAIVAADLIRNRHLFAER